MIDWKAFILKNKNYHLTSKTDRFINYLWDKLLSNYPAACFPSLNLEQIKSYSSVWTFASCDCMLWGCMGKQNKHSCFITPYFHATNNGMLKQEIELTHPEIPALAHKAHTHVRNSHMQMEKWKPAGQHNLICDIPIISLHLNYIWRKLHLWSSSSLLYDWTPPPSPFNLNNNLISYRHTITQFTHRHLAARTLSVRTRKVLHTLEYGTCDSWTSLVIWKRWKCDPVRTVCHSSVLSMIGRVVSFFATQCLVDYICICPLKIAFSTKKRQIQRDGKYLERNVLHIKYFIFSASTRGQFFFNNNVVYKYFY